MSKYTKQWMKLLKAEALSKKTAVQKRTKKLMRCIINAKDKDRETEV